MAQAGSVFLHILRKKWRTTTNVKKKCVLAHLLEHARPVKFSGGKAELESAVRETYKDVLQEEINNDNF